MIIPEFLKDGDLVGVTACSCGVLYKIDKYEKSISNFKKQNLRLIETDNVRTYGIVSSDIKTRVREFEELVKNPEVKMINMASGGDFLIDMLPYLNYDLIKKNVKWVGGSSDPTSLLYTITTNLDIATIYTPCNMSGYSADNLHKSYLDYFRIIKGDLVTQTKSDLHEGEDDIFDQVNVWDSFGDTVDEQGIIIGGCIDCLKDLIGTNLDKTKEFIEKYKDEGIIWYFDVFGLSSDELYRTLLQFENAGWFKYTPVILIGKVRIPDEFPGLTYEDAINNALSNHKVIYKFDVGHVKPSMTMINGMKARVKYDGKEGSLEYIK